MQGTIVFQPNVFDRLANAWRGFKALPTPGQLFPPAQQNVQSGFLTFPGWDYLERNSTGNSQDENRAKVAVQSPWVFADITAIANEFSTAELMVKEDEEDVDDHPLESLWQAPNPHMGRSYLMKYWAWSYTMVGKAYLYWLPAGGEVKELWPIPPFMITPIPSPDNFIAGYAFKARVDAKPIIIPAEYITYSHSVNLFDIRDGLSFLVAAMTGIESDLAMERWNRNFFDEQNGIPDGLITVQKETLDTDLQRIRSELRDFFGGTRRGVAVARSGDLDYKPFGRSQKEVEFKEGIELASKIIGRTLGFPDGYWSETANRANAEQARATMIAGAVWPLLVQLGEDLNAGPVPRFYGEQYRVEFKDIRPEDRSLKLQEQESRKTHWTINELREVDGKDPLKDPRGLMLIAEVGKGAPLPATPAAEMTEEYITEQEAEAGVGEEEAVPPEEAAPPVDEGTLEGGEAELLPEEMPMEEAQPVKVADLDLYRWERKALKALKRFHVADVRFDSVAIAPERQERIHAHLRHARTPEAVKAAFKAAPPAQDDTDALIDAEWGEALKWAKKVEG